MTPTGPLCKCWMMPEDTLQRWEDEARDQPEREAALLAGKKLFLWRSVEWTGHALPSLPVPSLILLFGNACTSELLWIPESMQILWCLLFVSFTYMYNFFLLFQATVLLRIIFCGVQLGSFHVKLCIITLDSYQSPFFIPFLYGELQTPEIIWSLQLVGEDWHVFLGSQAEFWLSPFL